MQQTTTATATDESGLNDIPQAPPISFGPKPTSLEKGDQQVLLEYIKVIAHLTMPVAIMAGDLPREVGSKVITACTGIVWRITKARDIITGGQCNKDEMYDHLCKEVDILNGIMVDEIMMSMNPILASSVKSMSFEEIRDLATRRV